MTTEHIFSAICYLIGITLVTFLVYRRDYKASLEMDWVVGEGKLLFLALAGGTLGGLQVMLFKGYKRYNSRFKANFYNILILQLALVGVLIYMNYGENLWFLYDLKEFVSDKMPQKPTVLNLEN